MHDGADLKGDGRNSTFIMVYEDVWQALLGDPEALAVYMALRRRTYDGNRTWYAKKKEMAEESGVSVATFERRIKVLQKHGLVSVRHQYRNPKTGKIGTAKVGDFKEQIQNIYTVQERTEAWYEDIAKSVGVTSERGGVTSQRGDTSPHEDVGVTSQRGANIDPLHTSPTQIPNTHDHPSADRFDEFWEVVPRKVGKKKARTEWDKAIKEVDADTIIDGMRRYRDDPNRVDAFTKHPSTWLSNGCWDDDPLPPREVPKPASRGGVENTLEAWGFVSEGSTLPWEDPAPTFDDTPFIDHQEVF